MNACKHKSCSFSATILFWLLASYPVTAEIVPDNTLPINSSVTSQDSIRLIEGGTPRGNNLFHSFREFTFSDNTGNTVINGAFFNNDPTVRNIITRVTGGSPSNIDGLISAQGTANLFFINPGGIIFGPNASLNIGGSFIASTANSIKFADGTEFSATTPETSPLLTVSVPLGLQFGSNPGAIVNQSQASPNGELTDADPPNPIGLKAPIGKTLALIGGNVTIAGGNLTTTSGRIELGSVTGTGLVTLAEIEKGYAFDYSSVQNFEDIQILQGSIIYASGQEGEIQLQGKNITLTEDSLVFSSTLEAVPGGNVVVNASNLNVKGGAFIGTFTRGEGQAGNVLVKVSDSVELSGTTSDGLFPSSIVSQVLEQATGNGGNLIIETGQLLIQDGAIIDASTFGVGQAGNIIVKASDTVKLVGVSANGLSGIFAQVAEGAIDNAGDAGTLNIDTRVLSVQGGAQIVTAARSSGNGGNLSINADLVQLSGTSPFATASLRDNNRSGIFVSAEPGATGNVGNLNLKTGLLTVENGARISADNLGTGLGGTATLNVGQLVIRDGGEVRAGSFSEGAGGILTVNATESVQLLGVGTIDSTPVPSTLFTQAESSGKAGSLNITTPSLTVQDGAVVTVSSMGTGSAGNLTIDADSIFLNRGRLTATTNAGEGANIKLQGLDLLLMQNQSLISAQAFNDADGGNINIDAADGFVIATPNQNNDIKASAVRGRGGDINITAINVFGLEERRSTDGNTTNDIDASSEFGLSGTVTINTPEVDPVQGLVELPTGVVDASELVASGCDAIQAGEGSEFIITGRGGMPSSPDEALSTDVVWSDTRLISGGGGEKRRVSTHNPRVAVQKNQHIAVVPATGWVFNGKGEVTLVAKSTSDNIYRSGAAPASCSKR